MPYTFKHGDRPLDGLTIQRAVGRGGFGEVYYALTDSGKQIAVKYLRDNPEVELRGIAHVMNLKSPHLITIYDVRHGEQDEPYVIMEYVSGPSLRDLLIAEPNGLGAQKTAFFIKGIAEGLSYLHQRGIVHRDLKPGNIFYDDGYVKIGDYGLSKHIAVSAHSGNTISVGTVHYMAPEIGSGSYSKSIDIYALGVMLYEMLTGRLPFTGSSMGEVLMRHLSDRPDISGIAEPFAGVIARCLAKDPADRYQEVDEMMEALIGESDLSASVASFDASVLAQTPHATESFDPDRTLTRATPPAPVPVMDAREAGDDLPPIPPIPPVLDRKSAKKAHKLRKKFEKRAREAEAVRGRLADMGIGGTIQDGIDRAAPVMHRRWRQILVTLFVLFAVSGGLGIAYHQEGTLLGPNGNVRLPVGGVDGGIVFGASLLYLLGGLIGTLLGYAFSVRRTLVESSFHDRLIYATTGFVCLLPGFAAGAQVGGGFERLVIPLAASLLLFDWTDRIQLGRRHIIQGGQVFWHGLVGCFIAAMASANDYVVAGGVLCAAMLVLVQLMAGVRPLPVSGPSQLAAAARRGKDHRRAGAWRHVEGAYERVASRLELIGDRLTSAGDNARENLEDAVQISINESLSDSTESDDADNSDTHNSRQSQPVIIEGYQPSFVGRTASAGLSFLAKLLLLAGLTAAILYSVSLPEIQTGDARIVIGNGYVEVIQNGNIQETQHIPRGVVFAPLLLGSIMLVVARRHDGAAHFVRGFFGCVLACVTAVLALGPLADAVSLVFSGNWNNLTVGQTPAQLIPLASILVGSLLLLFWPKASPRQQKPIVL